MGQEAVQYYRTKFGGDKEKAFIHIVKEVGELARALEKANPEMAKMEITEIAGLMQYLASEYGFDLAVSLQELYTRKLQGSKA